MLEQRFGRFVPRFLLQRLMQVETAIEEAVESFAAALPAGARVLDAGAGESRFKHYFNNQRYIAADLAIGDTAWNYSKLDVAADLGALPFGDASFDAALNIVTLEHLPDPGPALLEIGRALRPGGSLLLAAPQQWEVHQAPHDYFRFTRYGLTLLLARAGFGVGEIQPVGGYFTLLGRRLTGALNHFQGGLRWLFFPIVAVIVGPLALLLPALDFLDRDKDTTLAYICLVRKS